MSNGIERAKEVLQASTVALDGLQAILQITKVGDSTNPVIAAVKAIAAAVIDSLDGTIDVAEVREQIALLKANTAASRTDAAIDSLIDRKFPKGD